MYSKFYLKKEDKYKELNNILEKEFDDFQNTINLIGSANYSFEEVMNSHSYPLIMNPAEGFIKERLFPQCNNIDKMEILGDELLKELFNIGSNYETSLQIHSGTQANQAVYNAILNPLDHVLVMSLESGGHVSHHHYLNKFFNKIEYTVDKNENINYDQIEILLKKYKPKLLIAGATSYPREINYILLKKICEKYDTLLLADISHTAIYIANGNHCSPFNSADFISLTTHKTTRGGRGGILIYRKKFSRIIKKSIFPITQGAPKMNDMIAKIVMLIELLDFNIDEYVTQIFKYTNFFIDYFKEKKFFTNGSDSHLAILDLSKERINVKSIVNKLEEINILVNYCPIPNNNEPNGLRFGFLTMATLNVSMKDFEMICKIIYETIFNISSYTKNDTSKIINKYLGHK